MVVPKLSPTDFRHHQTKREATVDHPRAELRMLAAIFLVEVQRRRIVRQRREEDVLSSASVTVRRIGWTNFWPTENSSVETGHLGPRLAGNSYITGSAGLHKQRAAWCSCLRLRVSSAKALLETRAPGQYDFGKSSTFSASG